MRRDARISIVLRRSALRARALAFLAAGALAGCSNATKPSAEVAWTGLEDLGVLGATVEIEVAIANPGESPFEFGSIDWVLSSSDHSFANGTDERDGVVAAKGDRAVVIPARIVFRDLFIADASVEPGSVIEYDIELDVRPSADGESVSCRGSGRLPLPIAPGIRLEKVNWRLVTPDAARAVLAIWMKNRNAFPLELQTIDYRLVLSGREIIEEALAQPRRLDPGEEAILDIPISLRPRELGLAVFNLHGGDDAAYELSGTLGCRTPFGPVDLPFDARGRTVFVR